MMKFLLLIIAFAHTPRAEENAFANVIQFEKTWDQFIRTLSGCPLKGVIISPDMCEPAKRHWDYGLFLKARTRAMKLFDLKDK